MILYEYRPEILIKAKNIIDFSSSSKITLNNNHPNVNYGDKFYQNWFKYEDNWYYFKKTKYERYIVNELVGSAIAQYFSLPTVNYQIGYRNGDYGLLSKNLSQEKLFVQEDLWQKYYCELSEFLVNINKNFANKNLIKQFWQIALLNILMDQADFNYGSLLFKGTDENNIELVGILDFTMAEFSDNYYQSYCFDSNNDYFMIDVNKLSKVLKNFPSLEEDLIKFYNINLEQIFRKIENYYGIIISNAIKNICCDKTQEVKKYIKSKI